MADNNDELLWSVYIYFTNEFYYYSVEILSEFFKYSFPYSRIYLLRLCDKLCSIILGLERLIVDIWQEGNLNLSVGK